jgi:hypothetical protein
MSSRTTAVADLSSDGGSNGAVPTGPRLDRDRMSWSSWPLLLPAAVLLLALFVAPVAYSFYYGFTNLQLVGPPR